MLLLDDITNPLALPLHLASVVTKFNASAIMSCQMIQQNEAPNDILHMHVAA